MECRGLRLCSIIVVIRLSVRMLGLVHPADGNLWSDPVQHSFADAGNLDQVIDGSEMPVGSAVFDDGVGPGRIDAVDLLQGCHAGGVDVNRRLGHCGHGA